MDGHYCICLFLMVFYPAVILTTYLFPMISSSPPRTLASQLHIAQLQATCIEMTRLFRCAYRILAIQLQATCNALTLFLHSIYMVFVISLPLECKKV